MYPPQRHNSIMARQPMVYDRERNGSARSVKSTKTNYVDSDRPDEEDDQPLKPFPKPPASERFNNENRNERANRPKVYLRPGMQTRDKHRTRTLSREYKGDGAHLMKPMLSQPRYYMRDDKLDMMSETELENYVRERDDQTARGVLTRRRMNRAEMVYFPDIKNQPKMSSVRSSRSEPSWMEYSRARRFMHQRNVSGERPFNRFIGGGNRVRKNAENDKCVAFYRNFESNHPEIRMVINEQRFQDLFQLIDELSKILHLTAREKYIHSSFGTIIRDISEFEDNGVYFFGPPYIYEFGDYYKFREQNTPDLIESENGTESENTKRSNESENNEANVTDTDESPRDKCKEIKIISNRDGILRPIKFLIERKRHKSLFQVLYDLSELFSPRYGRVEGLCTRKGRTILNVGELFTGDNEEEYVAICAPMFDDTPTRGRNRFPSMTNDPYFSRVGGGRRSKSVNPPYHPHSHPSRKLEIEVMGKVHEFEAPAFEKLDPFTKKSDLPPQEQLELEWIYGYNGKNCRNNLFILPSEEVVYFVAKVVVLYDNENTTQRFYTEHTDEIRCMIQHPNLWIFASAQVSGSEGPDGLFDHVRIWNSKSLETLNTLSFDQMDLSIECLAFSQADNGVKLATVSTTGYEWTLSVWDWKATELLSKSEAYKQIDLACVFDPSNNKRVVSCGKQHVFFWDVSGDTATYDIGEFDGLQMPDYVTCLGFNSKNELITGDSNAFIHFWDKDEPKITSIIKTKHTGSIIMIQIMSGDHILTGGGSDRMLTLIDCNEIIPTVNEAVMSEEYGGIVAIAPFKPGFVGTDFSQMKLFLGTSMNTILYGTMDSQFECLVSATSAKLTSIAINSKDNLLLIAGYDCFAVLKAIETHEDIWRLKFDFPCTAATFYPNGEIIVVGTSSGLWIVLETIDAKQIASFQTDRSKVSCLTFSPDGTLLAIGTESGTVCLYNVDDDGKNYRFRTSIKSYQDEIVSIDWAANCTHFRFVTSAYDVDYFNVYSHYEESRSYIIRDIIYEKQTCALHYTTAGIWKSPESEDLFKAAAVSNDNKLLCAGTDLGNIRLYRYPANLKMPLYNESSINSSSISKVLFTFDDKSLITCGENDYCIAQWSVTKKNSNESSNQQQNLKLSQSYNSETATPRNKVSPRKGVTPRNGDANDATGPTESHDLPANSLESNSDNESSLKSDK